MLSLELFHGPIADWIKVLVRKFGDILIGSGSLDLESVRKSANNMWEEVNSEQEQSTHVD